MPSRFSHYLDLVRFVAAFVVLLSHFAYSRFTGEHYMFIRDYNLGSDAVVLFFVLSGFVIHYAARHKDKTLGRFTFSRLTRLYTVAIPALLITLICDSFGRSLYPGMYLNSPYYNALPQSVFWGRGLTFSNFWLGDAVRLGSNGPFWSLSYEAAYYVLFAIIMFTTGLKRLALTGLALCLFGLKVLLLAPAWIMGAWAYAYLQNRPDTEKVSSWGTLACMIMPVVIYTLMQIGGVAIFLKNLTYAMMGEQNFYRLAFSDEFLWNGLIGALFTIHLIGVYEWMKLRPKTPKFGRAIRWLAGGSFSLYLVHYPVLQFLGAGLPETAHLWVNHAILLGLTIVICYLFAAIFERPLHMYRRVLRQFGVSVQHRWVTATRTNSVT